MTSELLEALRGSFNRRLCAGRKTATAEGRVHDPDGRLVAHGTTTCIIHR